MIDTWSKNTDEGKYVGVLLLDLSKAFDTVSHQKLLHKLQNVGLSAETLAFFFSYLTDRAQRVVNKKEIADWKSISRGVPQGSCLSPLLFNLYISDLPRMDDIDLFQYADDSNESAADYDLVQLGERLSESFNLTKQYCDENDLILNDSKTQLIVLKQPSKRMPDDFSVVIGTEKLVPLKSVKLLGFTVDRHLTFTAHVDSVVQKANSALALIRRARKWIPREIAKLAYCALARSHLEYCSAVFYGMSKINKE